MTHYSKYPPAKPEALWVAGPSKGPYRDPKSKSRASGSMLVADILEARSILLELSNFYCLPGRAGGSPVRSKYPPAKPEALWVAGPSKGPYRDPKSKSRASGSMLVADILEARSILLELSNFYCLPGRAGGSPVRTSHSWILGMEAFATIASYSADAAVRLRQELEQAGMRLITRDRVRISYEVFFDLVPDEHMEFLKNLKPFHCNADVVCVHGGVLDDSPVHLQDPQTLIWGPRNFPGEYNGHETVVYGHWNNPVIDESGWPWPRAKANHTFGIDTISHGVLTAMSFPDGKIFQSNRYPIADEIH